MILTILSTQVINVASHIAAVTDKVAKLPFVKILRKSVYPFKVVSIHVICK